MSIDLCELPFTLRANLDGRGFSGEACVEFEFSEYGDNCGEPFLGATEIWAKAASQQFFTGCDVDTRISLGRVKAIPEDKVFSLELSCEHVESGAWLVLLGLISQTAYPDLSLKRVQIQLANGAAVVGAEVQTWQMPAVKAIFTPRFMPAAFPEPDQLILGETIDISLEFGRKLKRTEFAHMEDGLELWGCLVGMGALRFDFVEMEAFEPNFGSTTRLTSEWIEYCKPVFEGPNHSVYLLDHWARGLARLGLAPRSLSISQ